MALENFIEKLKERYVNKLGNVGRNIVYTSLAGVALAGIYFAVYDFAYKPTKGLEESQKRILDRMGEASKKVYLERIQMENNPLEKLYSNIDEVNDLETIRKLTNQLKKERIKLERKIEVERQYQELFEDLYTEPFLSMDSFIDSLKLEVLLRRRQYLDEFELELRDLERKLNPYNFPSPVPIPPASPNEKFTPPSPYRGEPVPIIRTPN